MYERVAEHSQVVSNAGPATQAAFNSLASAPAAGSLVRMPRLPALVALVALILLVPACADRSSRQQVLDRSLYTYAGMIRWGEFEAAQEFVDPEVRAQAPLTELDLERFRHLQISGYHVKASGPTPDGGVARVVDIGVINRHTQAERVVQAREIWRWDAQARRWWLTTGLPVLTAQP